MRKILIITTFGLCLLNSAVTASAEELRPVTHADVWLMQRIGTPVTSPDGKRVVVSVTKPSYEEDGSESDLWLLTVDGETEAVQLTATKESEGGVVWSPDGKKIAFSTKRGEEEASQIYILNMDGPGEAIPVTSLSTGAKRPKWSPDGRHIAFESRVYPGATDDEANKAEKEAREDLKINVSVYEMFPIRQWDHWRDDMQTHLFVQEAKAGAEAKDLLAGSKLIEAQGFAGTPSRSSDSLKPVWTPDGKALVFNATTALDEAAHARVKYHLYSVPVTGGEPEQLTSSNDWSCTDQVFSEDGKVLYCRYEPENQYVYNLNGIGRFDWSKKGIRSDIKVITSAFDRSVTGMDISKWKNHLPDSCGCRSLTNLRCAVERR